MPRPPNLGLCGLTLVAVVTLCAAAGRNLAPDAVTRATTWNEHRGELGWLTDGVVPPAADARVFAWNTKGILAFSWDGVADVDRVRIRVGEVANDYQVRTYIGGYLDDNGATRDPQGQQTARVDDLTRVVDGWHEIQLPEGTRGDNLELRTLGPAQFFEVEILIVDGTAVGATSWAAVKARSAR